MNILSLIVLDDIERKHANLSVDEVMASLMNSLNHGARIILILNSDQLADRSLLDKLREKVIDQEVRLETSPIEAFDIALGLFSSTYASLIKKAIKTCGITHRKLSSDWNDRPVRPNSGRSWRDS